MTFSLPLTPDKLDAARSRLHTQGIPVPESDSGRIEVKGVVAEYSYDGVNFTVQIIKKPSLLPESYVERAVREWFA